MKLSLLKYLACPQCAGEFKFLALSKYIDLKEMEEEIFEKALDMDERSNETFEICSGIFLCENKHVFPVIKGIPRLFADSTGKFYSFLEKYMTLIPGDMTDEINKCKNKRDKEFEKDFRHTQKSFSAEWDAVKDDNSAWGRTIEDRKKLFFQTMDISADDLKGKTVLDVGHGHGEVELSICDSGAEIIAADLSFSGENLFRRLSNLPEKSRNAVHLVQANAHFLPFRKKAFDFVHSAGVLHHTPDTQKGFASVSSHLKPNGKCYIEVYSHEKKNILDRAVFEILRLIRLITLRLPHSILHIVCAILALPGWLYMTFYNKFLSKKLSVRSLNEMRLSIFDHLSPRYDHHHTTDEVTGWFVSLGYDGMKKTFENHNGFGISGKLK